MDISYSCNDYLGFQESLKKMRGVDDKIIHVLNTSLPTESFRGQINQEKTCKELYARLRVGHEEREIAIRGCIAASASTLKALREKRDNKPEDVSLDQQFKQEQRKLRVLQSELDVEEIVKNRSYKAFNERCRAFFHAGAAL